MKKIGFASIAIISCLGFVASCSSGKYDWDKVSDFITKYGRENDIYLPDGEKFSDNKSVYIFEDTVDEPHEAIFLSREEKNPLESNQTFDLYFQANYYALVTNYIVGFSFEWQIGPYDKDQWELMNLDTYFYVGGSENASSYHSIDFFGIKGITFKDGEYVSSTTYSVPSYPEDDTPKPSLPQDEKIYQNKLLSNDFSKTTAYLKANHLELWY